MTCRRIVFFGYPELMLLDLAGPAQVFHSAARARPQAGLSIELVSQEGAPVRSDVGFGLGATRWDADPAPIDTLIIPGGEGARTLADDSAGLARLRAMAGRSRRIASVCIGAFALGAAGLLDGRRATTHWRWCAALETACPGVAVEPDRIFVQDGPVWTSAGVTAGVDMALAMVEADFGRALALEIARSMVVFLRRPGGQTQFSAALRSDAADRDGDFSALHAWIAADPARDLRVEALAAQAGMAPRSFCRAYKSATGETPARMVEALRVEAARRRLEQGDAPVKTIAAQTGFGAEERMRRAFHRRLGVSPVEYRARFRDA